MTDYNRKSHMHFQFVPKSVTFDKLQRFLSVAYTRVYGARHKKTYLLLDFIFRLIILCCGEEKNQYVKYVCTTLLSLVHTGHYRRRSR